MKLRGQLLLFCFMIDIGREECSDLQKIVMFLVFLAAFVFYYKFLGRLMIDLY